MSELTTRAQVIDASQIETWPSRIPATLRRDELQEALRIEEIPELVLDVASRDNGDVEAHTLRVTLTEDQLKELLTDADGEEITLFFDPAELQALLGEEAVEAHGVREKTAAVLTVAAVAAGVAASAHPASAAAATGAGAGSGIEMISDAASSGVAQAPELISDAASSGSREAPELISDAASSGPAPVQAASTGPELISDAASSGPAPVQAASTGPELISDAASSGPAPVQAASTGPELISDAASSGPAPIQAASSGPELISDAASSGPAPVQAASTGPELISDAASTGTISAAQAGAVSTAGTDDSGLSASEIAGTAVGGGLVLLITAAGFATRGRRRVERPA
jgi:hypothetical protein